MMALTKEQSDTLKAFFPVQSHEFLNGNTYIAEEAITNRLDDVDPSWTWELIQEYTRENQCIAVGRMTVCGVTRDGVGMQPLTIKKKDGTIIDGTEPEKSAATDALKRAARLFGIGRYILEMGRDVNDYQSLAKWLNERGGQNATQSSATAPKNGAPAQTPTTPAKTPVERLNSGGKKNLTNGTWTVYRNDLLSLLSTAAANVPYQERGNTVNKMHEEGAFEGIGVNEAAKMVLARLAAHEERKAS